MIRLARPFRQQRETSVVPMINVAFLLLIFFLMCAVILPPDPLEVASPLSATGSDAGDDATLTIGADGALALGGTRGEAVFDAVGETLRIRADAALEASELARILARLGESGVQNVELLTLPR